MPDPLAADLALRKEAQGSSTAACATLRGLGLAGGAGHGGGRGGFVASCNCGGVAKTKAATAAGAGEVEAYLARIEPRQRAALERLRGLVLQVVPDAVEGLSYGMPALKLEGKGIAGFAAFKGHLSYFPMSSNVVPALEEELAGFPTSKGTVQFTLNRPLPAALVRKLVRTRLAELKAGKAARRPSTQP